MLHYTRAIRSYSTTDNYNTESTEHLHINFAKEAYRASNHKDEFPQMTKWLERRAEWTGTCYRCTLNLACTLHLIMTKHPSHKSVLVAEVVSPDGYGATFFSAAFTHFVVETNSPNLTWNEVKLQALQVQIPFSTLPVFHKIKFHNIEHHGRKHSMLFTHGHNEQDVTVLDSFPHILTQHSSRPNILCHLVYIKWLSKFMNAPDEQYQMYKIKTLQGPARLGSIIPLSLVQHSVHLFPKWGGPVPAQWTSENILDKCNTFYLNDCQSLHSFHNLY
ncbi:hypothetical protein C8Q72DRAFT_797171 [Fomitopsis betulina]|nr:hypothetical protein C8Q72DRAFT_797171 [Fomitopsis betulina]